ncbi:hypothetical protein [Rhizobium rosettiformans]|uniref:hypothetical protein n=1 Tax=Rhizobium rosettiformans TaxID=1368430 RepID=UPI00285661C4|nr:hypothetical protein [Rhizobium rosettiformans]MDR7029817.1 hypothetical protein [Rhizobium rosettiformans]MDR7063531.1 hypothetical protein [Rhizobium rosettiformans]
MASLIVPAQKSESSDLSRDARDHAERVARAKAAQVALAEINAATSASITRQRSAPAGPTHLLLLDDAPAATAPVQARKADPATLHPKAAAVASTLSADAAELFSLVLRADEHYRRAQLIDLAASEVARAMGLSEKAAVAAREELESRRLIAFYDSGTGRRGFYPTS